MYHTISRPSGCVLVAGGLALIGMLFSSSGCSSSSSSAPVTEDSGTADHAAPTMEATSGMHTVTVGPSGTLTFSPSTLSIAVGDTVHWVWMSSGHSVTSGTVTNQVGMADNKFCSPDNKNCATGTTSAAGTTYDFTFTTAGSYPYFCSPHASLGMVGTITVQ